MTWKNVFFTGFIFVQTTLLPAQQKNGFDLDGALIDAGDILFGGPPRDGIPALFYPELVHVQDADFVDGDDRVYGMVRSGKARAYPVSILNWHEIVNDTLGGDPVVVTYCPLCGSGMAFSSLIRGSIHTFGVSGLLYNSDVLLYDRNSGSLWSQLMSQAISGKYKGEKLSSLPMTLTTWREWLRQYPNTTVLSNVTGYKRDYERNPYSNYPLSPDLYFPVSNKDRRYHPKQLVIGVELDGQYKAYAFSELDDTDGVIEDRISDMDIEIRYDTENETASVFDSGGKEIPAVILYWFAWYAFHPDTDVFENIN